jgi:hypothetical protein
MPDDMPASVPSLAHGDQRRAVCRHCARVASVTYQLRSVALYGADSAAATMLAGVCDTCGHVVALPAQSTPAIKQAKLAARHAVAALLPAPYLDALDTACAAIAPDTALDFRRQLVLHYVHQFASGQRDIARLKAAAKARSWLFPDAEQAVRKRYAMTLSMAAAVEFKLLMAQASMSKTTLLKALICQIRDDTSQPSATALRGELQRLSHRAGMPEIDALLRPLR